MNGNGKRSLSLEHYRMLRDGSGISDAIIIDRDYQTVTEPADLEELGFSRVQARNVPGLLLPVTCTDGSNGLAVYRPDTPRRAVDKSRRDPETGDYKTKFIKYELPPKASVRIDCPKASRRYLANPEAPLWITEGQKKADALATRGVCSLALLGVWNFKGKNEFGSVTVLADFDHVAWKQREVRLVFDSDVMTKQGVRAALDRFTEILQRRGAHVSAVYLPMLDGAKVGVDDYLLTHSIEDLEALIEGPRPQIKAAAPVIELLENEPLTMKRPIVLLEGKAYCAIWPMLEIRETEFQDNRTGTIIKHAEPKVTRERRCLIVREDGRIFSSSPEDDDFDSLSEITVKLPTVPEERHLWSTPAVKAYYVDGKRPEPGEVFSRVVAVINHYIDFDQSLTDQNTMAEMCACYCVATWFLDAFQVIGFLFPNGEFGSGKSELLNTVTLLSYLGEMVMAQSTLATLRDLADYGGTLAFDEVERLQQDKTKSDLMAILLAGNRKGATLAAKEPAGKDGDGWITKRYDMFCPRLFAASRLPDGALATRSIIVPLVRSVDAQKPNRMVTAVESWTKELGFSRRELIDSLWALSCANLSKLPDYDRAAASRSPLRGRQLEPWRAILAVAEWLEAAGVADLATRMHALAEAYQKETQGLDSSNLTVLVIRALDSLLQAPGAVSGLFNTGEDTDAPPCLKTREIAEECKRIAEVEELPVFIDPSKPGSFERTIGWIMKKLRFVNIREGHARARGWAVVAEKVERHKRAFGLIPPSHVEITEKTSAITLENETTTIIV